MPQTDVHRVEKLTAADYDELIPFLARAFDKESPTWFADRLPTIYQPTDDSMSCNLAVRIGGRIAAVVGIFPLELAHGTTTLRVAGVGGVSVDPDHRRSGLMRLLMNAAVDEIRSGGYELSYLGGQRQRYRYFGWERSGLRYTARLDPVNLAHEFRDAASHGLTLTRVDADDRATLDRIADLLERQPVRCVRDRATVYRRLVCWGAEAYAVRDGAGRIVGYCAVNPPARAGAAHVAAEIVCDTDERFVAVCRAIVEHAGGPLDIELTPPVSDGARRLVAIAEHWSIVPSGNWQVLDWKRTLEAFLRMRASESELAHGSVTVEIIGEGTYEIVVDTSGVRVSEGDRAADISLSPTDALPVLFGPARPSAYTRVSGVAAILEAWCPLPLALNRQDEV